MKLIKERTDVRVFNVVCNNDLIFVSGLSVYAYIIPDYYDYGICTNRLRNNNETMQSFLGALNSRRAMSNDSVRTE